jgi:hypothetical protein
MPKKFDTMIQRVYKKALPFLGVNRKIKLEWRTLPEMYQGLGMPNMPLLALLEKISFLLGNWGFPGQAHSDALSMAYENLLMGVGLHGSPLQWKYSEYGHLATEATWFQNLWLLVSTYEVDTSFRDKDTVQGIRENDCSLMAEFYQIGYRGKQFTGLNVVCCFWNLLHISDIVHCNGLTVDEFVLSDNAEVSPKYTFLQEQPTTSDFKLWKEALNCLCLGTTRLPYTLGRYLRHPHLPCQWYTNESAEALFYIDSGTEHPEYEVYQLQPSTVGTWHGRKYDWYLSKTGIHPGTHFASVSMISPTCAEMYLGAPFLEIQTQSTLFLEVLDSYEDCGLWDQLFFDGDGE